ncbi:hypothetical protein CDD80_5504 [Ophiocordyceps camponoti-rufipedis]|uniref:Uncharacterized protein n=1 Tax=Ophiocordyceps camponoti-rufipedis TaxID=2004952 RepID=A0A2C5YUU3_9HYPO|nr:hypothetical protein CDD80_5504 [Ophiocordyceps camponoti-rufipedis]
MVKKTDDEIWGQQVDDSGSSDVPTHQPVRGQSVSLFFRPLSFAARREILRHDVDAARAKAAATLASLTELVALLVARLLSIAVPISRRRFVVGRRVAIASSAAIIVNLVVIGRFSHYLSTSRLLQLPVDYLQPPLLPTDHCLQLGHRCGAV